MQWLGARAPGTVNEPKIMGSIQPIHECEAFANTDSNEVVKFFQNKAKGTFNEKHKVS